MNKKVITVPANHFLQKYSGVCSYRLQYVLAKTKDSSYLQYVRTPVCVGSTPQ